jgi:tetratricopeptide (TPR) repeat protein
VNTAEIDRLALAVAKEPGSKAFIPLAEEYGKAGMWDEAAVVLEDGLKANPHFVTAMVSLGRAYDQLKQPIKAVAILEEAVKLSPENLRAHRTLAKIYAAQGAKDPALRSCRVILAANPQDQEALSLCATLETFAVPPSTEHTQPRPAVEPVRPVSEAGTTSEPREERQSAGVLQEKHPESPTGGAAASLDHKSATMIRLEEWLTSIQARRRHPGASSDKNS